MGETRGNNGGNRGSRDTGEHLVCFGNSGERQEAHERTREKRGEHFEHRGKTAEKTGRISGSHRGTWRGQGASRNLLESIGQFWNTWIDSGNAGERDKQRKSLNFAERGKSWGKNGEKLGQRETQRKSRNFGKQKEQLEHRETLGKPRGTPGTLDEVQDFEGKARGRWGSCEQYREHLGGSGKRGEDLGVVRGKRGNMRNTCMSFGRPDSENDTGHLVLVRGKSVQSRETYRRGGITQGVLVVFEKHDGESGNL